jgi:hypothetical protein
VLQTWFWGPFGTCSSNSTVPIVPPPPPCAAVRLALDPPSGTMRQLFLHSNYPHLSRDTTSVADVVRGQFGTCSSNSTHLFRHHHHVLWRDWPPDPPSGTIRQGFHIQTTHTYGDATSVADVVRDQSAHAAQILPFHLFRHHHVLQWDWHQIHPLAP